MNDATNLGDLRCNDPRWRPPLDCNEHGAAQAIAVKLRVSESDQQVYRNVQKLGVQCADLYYFDNARNVDQVRRLEFYRTEMSIDLYTNISGNEVLHVG